MKEDENLVITNDNKEKIKRIKFDIFAVICILIYCFALSEFIRLPLPAARIIALTILTFTYF